MDEHLFESGKERAEHQAAVDHLAEQTHRPKEEVDEAYEIALRLLLDGARVKNYLSVIAVKHAKEALRHGAKPAARQ